MSHVTAAEISKQAAGNTFFTVQDQKEEAATSIEAAASSPAATDEPVSAGTTMTTEDEPVRCMYDHGASSWMTFDPKIRMSCGKIIRAKQLKVLKKLELFHQEVRCAEHLCGCHFGYSDNDKTCPSCWMTFCASDLCSEDCLCDGI